MKIETFHAVIKHMNSVNSLKFVNFGVNGKVIKGKFREIEHLPGVIVVTGGFFEAADIFVNIEDISAIERAT